MEASRILHAPAKLNLTLEVLGGRSDGMHGVRSVMVPIDLCDVLHVRESPTPAFSCSRADLQRDNIAERALRALPLERPVALHLEKHIPTGAGMGGGSSDAAAVLLAAVDGVFGPLTTIDYIALARSLGSDVPFFLVRTAALVEGTGERVTALGEVPQWHAVIVHPGVSVSTGWAYRQLDAFERGVRPRNTCVSLALGEALQRSDFESVVRLMQNDFHETIAGAHPEVARAIDALVKASGRNALLTGSGSCVFVLAKTREERDRIAGRVSLPSGFTIYACAFRRDSTWRSAA